MNILIKLFIKPTYFKLDVLDYVKRILNIYSAKTEPDKCVTHIEI